jgi:hypothetical protein
MGPCVRRDDDEVFPSWHVDTSGAVEEKAP